jgi:hypothetical protein
VSVRSTLSALVALYKGDAKRIASGYRQAFQGDRVVLRDLAGLCLIGEAVSQADLERVEGRREVFWHICNVLRIDPLEIERIVNEEGYQHDDR